MEPALRIRAGGPASQYLTRRMAQGFQRYREGDREGAVEGFLGAVCAPGYREIVEHVVPGSWSQAMQDADTFFGMELPELQRWQFGEAEAKRIAAPTLSLVGANSAQRSPSSVRCCEFGSRNWRPSTCPRSITCFTSYDRTWSPRL